MSQEQLGRRAGYRAGAGVSISRVESGLTRPGPDRLAGIGLALGATPEQLNDQAVRLADQNRDHGDGTEPGGGSARGAKTGSQNSTKARLKRVQEILDKRTMCVQDLGEAFNNAHDSARDEFFMNFIEIADHITGAPEPPLPAGLTAEEDTTIDPGVEAQYRLKIASHGIANALLGGAGGATAGAAAGGGAAYALFTAAAMLGSASTGAAISGLSGVAATNAALALLGGGTLAAGGAGVAGGTLLLTGLVAAPAALLALGGLVWMTRRNRKHEAALREQLDRAEAGIASAQRGFEALVDVLPRATEILDYIAVHASHAFKKWRTDLAPRPIAWSEMTFEQQQRYQDFITIAGCQLSVVSIGVEELMTTEGEQLEHLIEVANAVLTRAAKTVEALA